MRKGNADIHSAYAPVMGRITSVDEVGAALRKLRKARGLTQTQSSGRVDVAQSSVSDWETGAELPTLENFVRYVASLDATIEIVTAEEAKLRNDSAAALTADELEDLAAFVRRVGGARGTVREVLFNYVRASKTDSAS